MLGERLRPGAIRMRPKAQGRVLAAAVALLSLLAFPSPAQSANLTVSGTVMSGATSTISGSSVTLFEAGSGPGVGATSLGSSTSNSSGDFSISPGATPPAGAILYLVAGGGNAGGGANSSTELMLIIGGVSNAATSLTINELTTVAAAYSAVNFFTSGTGIADNAFHGLAIAAASAGNLANIHTGLAGNVVANGNNDPTELELNTLANALANCVRVGTGAQACANLFGAANAPTTPTDTLAAIINVAKTPTYNIGTIFGLGSSGPYSPVLPAAPSDWTTALNFTGGGLDAPGGIAIDSAGNVWLANTEGNSVTELSSAGTPVSSSLGFTGGGLNAPSAIAIDGAGNAWVADYGNDRVTEINSSGMAISPAFGYSGGGLLGPQSIAIDAAGNVWVANLDGNSVTELNSAGTPISSATGFTGGGLQGGKSIAIDGAGNIWVANHSDASVTELNSAGTPISPAGGFTGGGLAGPYGIAIDGIGDVWVANQNGNSVTELTSAGVASRLAFTGGGLSSPDGIVIDGAGNVWVSNGGGGVAEINPAGIPLSTTNGFNSGGVNTPFGIAVDGAGDIWVANSGSSSVTEIIGAGVSVKTPLVARLASLPTAVPTPTPTPSPTPASSPTPTSSPSSSATPTPTPSPTTSATPTSVPTATPTSASTPTPTASATSTSGVTATATKAPTPTPTATPTAAPSFLLVTPPSVNFQDVGIDTRATQRLKLTNTGTAKLTGSVSKDALSAPFSVKAGAGNFQLGHNQSKVVTIGFAPTSPTASSESLTITSDDPTDPNVQVGVSGIGEPGILSTSAAPLDFPAVKANHSKKLKFAIKNTGPGVLHVNINVSQSGTAFSVVGAAGFSLAHNASRVVMVKFAPPTSGDFAGTIVITSDGGGVSIPVSGTGD